MQALILAAGMGRRLGELTKENTKCMIKVHGVSLIERMLTQLSEFPFKRVIIVVGYQGGKVKELIGSSYKGLPVKYVENEIYDTTNNIYSLALAKHLLLEDDTVLLESDLIISKEIIADLITNPYPSLAVVAKYQSWMDGTVVTIGEDSSISGFIPKRDFNSNHIDQYYKTVNIYKFSRSFSRTHYVPFLDAYTCAIGNNEYYEQVLRVITLLEKPEIKALKTDGKWYEIDDIQDLDNAEVLFAPSDKRLALVQKRYGGYWRYPDLLDYCYLVNPYFPNIKLRDELKVNFDSLLNQYPSGQDVNAILAANVFGIRKEFMAVGNGAAELIKALMEEDSGIRTGMIFPSFEEYSNRLKVEALSRYEAEEPDYSYTVNDIKKWLVDNDRFVLINPDNPSGNYVKHADVLTLLDFSLKKGKQIVIDESFVDFSDEGEAATLLDNDLLMKYPNLVVVKSISKSYGVPGIRLGIVASGDRALIQRVKKRVSIWNINSIGEFFLQIIDKYKQDYLDACQKFKLEQKRLYHELQRISYLRVIPSQSNYFLCEVLPPFDSKSLTDNLLNYHNLLIKDCSMKAGFRGKSYVRIAVRDHQDNDFLVKVLKLNEAVGKENGYPDENVR